jgi:hypothetical protein
MRQSDSLAREHPGNVSGVRGSAWMAITGATLASTFG